MSGRNWRERGSLAVTFVALAAWSVSAAHPPVEIESSGLLKRSGSDISTTSLRWNANRDEVAALLAAACPDVATPDSDKGYTFEFVNKAGEAGGADLGKEDAAVPQKVESEGRSADGCIRATGCNGKLTMTLCSSGVTEPVPLPSSPETTPHLSVVPVSSKLTLQCSNDWPAVCFDSNKQPFCANLATDSRTCGCCSTNCATQQNKVCINGQCAPCPTATPDTCTGATGAFCVNLKTDVNFCGSCTTVCPKTGVAVCQNGVCNACPNSATPNVCNNTDGTARCVNFQSDNSNCGRCSNACASPTTCSRGVCVAPPKPPPPPPPPPSPPPPSSSLPIIWADDFSGATLNASNWGFDVGAGAAYGNNELVYYTNGANLGLSNGNAVITARYNPNGGAQKYTSTRISTCGRQAFSSTSAGSRGIRIEARAQLPAGGQGIWPKFWVGSPDDYYGGWPESGYMVLFEAQNSAATVYGSAFWGNPEAYSQKSIATATYRPLTDFHVFAIDWYPDRLLFYLDGNLYLTIPCSSWYTSDSTGRPKGVCAPFDRPFCLGVNLAVGADLLGPGVDVSVLPQTLTIDYIRVYSLATAPASSPSPPPPRRPPPPPPSPPPPPPAGGLQLLWSDEFSGTTLSTANWGFDVGNACDMGYCGWGNNELEWYTAGNNVAVSNGNAVITVNYNPNGGAQKYTSTRMVTRGKRAFAPSNGVNGRGIRVEARIKLPAGGLGMWPAFWMLANNNYYGNYPETGEIDIMEAINNLDTCYGTAHWGNPYANSGGQTPMASSLPQSDYHVFAVDWSTTSIIWRLDGVPYFTMPCSKPYTSDSAGNPRGPCAPFDQPFYIIINVAVGGDWPGGVNNAIFPQTMLVDYVRVYSL